MPVTPVMAGHRPGPDAGAASPAPDAGDAAAPALSPAALDDDGGDPTTLDAAAPVGLGDSVPPRLEAMSPADGDGPITSERVHLRFSEAMDASSVEAAFPAGSAFSWSADGSSVEFQLPLPFGESAQVHGLVVPAGVRDAAGNALGADVEARVTLAALARITLPLHFALTGHVLQGTDSAGTFLRTGDAPGGGLYLGAASFSLAELPSFAAHLGVRRATLQLQISDVVGDPGAALGGVQVDHVSFTRLAVIDDPIAIDSGFAALLEPGPIALGQRVAVDVAGPLASAWAEGAALLQLRFAPRRSNFNGVADYIYLRRVIDENDAVVAEGVLDPDPDNAARIEVEYFH